ncbi:MAG: CHAT domain-containing protein, partial [Chloroflexi bacterium]|nr:CHAT domain-containing protein [Chloroflexota bacterium]
MIARNQELRQREAQPMEYFSFDLRLGDWNPQTHTGEAEVLYSPAGEGRRYRFLLELDIEATAQRTHRTPAEAMGLGRALFESVFTEASLSLWRESYQIARERGRGLRLRLHINSWELGRVPWELLYDPRQGEFLVFDPHVSVVRYIRIGSSPPILRQTSTLKIMAVVASPQDLTQLDCDGEIKMLRQALQELIASGQVELIVSQHTTHEKLHMELLDHQPDVVHFVGHGEYVEEERAGYLILEDDRGLSHRLNATEAARMLRRYGTNLVLLNACETATGAWAGLAPALVRAEVAAVVAMQWPVEDRAAVRFTRSFYKALAQGRSIDECMAEGRVGASAASDDPNDWTAPVLFLRSISGQLWTQDLRRAPGKRPAEASAAQAFLPTFRGFAPEQEALFKTRGPLLSATDIDLIIDRPALQRALRIARQPSVTQYVAILSARQTGKTTLLLRLRDLLQGDLVCIFIDLSVLSAQDVSACFGFVAFRLLSELRELLGDDLPMLATRQVDSSVEFLEFLRELADNVAVPRIVLLIDEVGALAPDVSDSFFNTLRTVFTEGRTLTGRLAKYLFVFSGAVDLYTLTSGNNSPLNICEKIYLNDFDLDDVRKIVAQFGKLG